jgi:hypothetical protein
MEAQVLLDKYFETAFSAPDGVKKLRELILVSVFIYSRR